MSSGTLPLSTYHRAQSLGEGTYGSVVVVYNGDGEEYALKLFLDDEDTDDKSEEGSSAYDLGAVREISILRLLRGENGHPNIVPMIDVKSVEIDYGEEEEYGAGTSGCLGMTLPLYSSGTLGNAIDSGSLRNRGAKVAIAHGLLSAVAFLHENGIIHRDIKPDNVMLEPSGSDSWKPVLIDFSLAKVVNGVMYGQGAESFRVEGSNEEATHTGEVGTVTYVAPEAVAGKRYGLSSDLWSVGVLLLEMLQNHTLPTSRNKQAAKMIEESKEDLPDQPFPNLVRGLLTVDADQRLTVRKALLSPLFLKYGMEPPSEKVIDMSLALPLDQDENEENCHTINSTKGSNKKRKNPVLQHRKKMIQRVCQELDCTHPLTKHAALTYSEQLFQLDDTLDDMSESQSLLDCVVLASKFFETELTDLQDLEEESKGSFANWSLETYLDNEGTIWMLMDHCLYPRVITDWDN